MCMWLALDVFEVADVTDEPTIWGRTQTLTHLTNVKSLVLKTPSANL